MKNIFSVVFCLFALMFSAACGVKTEQQAAASAAGGAQERNLAEPKSNQNQKILVAYFSHSGNTKYMAEQIQAESGGDIFEIKTVASYPQDYQACTEQAKKELAEKFRPELAAKVEDMPSYDIVFLGYPVWWGTMPMAVFSFLESYDFGGKTIIPFCTHGGSKAGRSEGDIKNLVPSAEVKPVKPVYGSSVRNSDGEISSWVKSLGLSK